MHHLMPGLVRGIKVQISCQFPAVPALYPTNNYLEILNPLGENVWEKETAAPNESFT